MPSKPKSRLRSIPIEVIILSAAFLFIFMGAGAQQQFLAPFFGANRDWSPIVRGLVPAAVYVGLMCSRIPALWVVSRIGERAAMLIGGGAYVAFPLVVYFVNPLPLLIIGALLWGSGAALMWVTGSIRIIDAVSARNYGKASGVFVGSVHTGVLAGMLVLSWTAGQFGLHAVFLVASILSAAGWIIMMTLPGNHAIRTVPDIPGMLAVTRLPNWSIVAALLGLAALGYGLMLVPLGEALVETLGVSSLALAAIYPAGRLIVSLTGGWLSDVVGRRGVIVAGFMMAGAGLAVTAHQFGEPWAMALGIFSVGLLGGIAPAVGLAFVGDVATPERRLMVHASLFTSNDLGVATAIIAGQFLRGSIGGFVPTFAAFSVALIACGIWAAVSFRPVAVMGEDRLDVPD